MNIKSHTIFFFALPFCSIIPGAIGLSVLYIIGVTAMLTSVKGLRPIQLDNVQCSGTEQRLLSCSHLRSHDCGHRVDACDYWSRTVGERLLKIYANV